MRGAALITVLVVTVPLSAGAAVIHVDHAGGGDCTTIQAGIDAAGEGDTVLVWPGTYAGPGNRGLDPVGTNVVVRCRDGPGTVTIDCEWRTRAFHLHSLEDSSTVIDGFVLVRGREEYGGAIRCDHASPRLSNLRVYQNSAAKMGGGIHLVESGSVLIDIAFIENGACNGGGGVMHYGGSPTFTRCSFKGNSGRSTGGGVLSSLGSAVFEECEFWSNVSGAGFGGAVFKAGGYSIFSECLFHRNSAARRGGAFCGDAASPVFVDCEFYENESPTGGGVRLEHCDSRFERCRFIGNIASAEGGALATDWGDSIQLDGCLFERNLSPNGAGGWLEDVSLSASACRFAANQAEIVGGALACWTGAQVSLDGCTFSDNGAGYLGGAVHAADNAAISVSGCTFAGNSAILGGTLMVGASAAADLASTIVAFSGLGEAVRCDVGGGAMLACCDLFGNEGGDWVGAIADQLGAAGNVCEDPRFCWGEHAESPYMLHADSCCAEENNPECGQVGAWGVGCGVSPVVTTTWGAVKALFREGATGRP